MSNIVEAIRTNSEAEEVLQEVEMLSAVELEMIAGGHATVNTI